MERWLWLYNCGVRYNRFLTTLSFFIVLLGPLAIGVHLSTIVAVACVARLRGWHNFGFAFGSFVQLLVIFTQYPTIVEKLFGLNIGVPISLGCGAQALLGTLFWILKCQVNILCSRLSYRVSKYRYRSQLWRWQPVAKSIAISILVSCFLAFLPFWDVWTNYVQEGEGLTCSINFTTHDFQHVVYILTCLTFIMRCLVLTWAKVPYIIKECLRQIRALYHEGQRPIDKHLYLYKDQLRRSANVTVTLITLVNLTLELLCSLPYMVVLVTGVFNVTNLLPPSCITYASLILKSGPILTACTVTIFSIYHSMWIRHKLPHLANKLPTAKVMPQRCVQDV